ncbi:response regulator transcription factor [Streptomyces sp. A3M-1-3]|nr:response regulator transcription factor [Streptomyces sp. A3M-1-3]
MHILRGCPELDVVGEAAEAVQAVQLARILCPDVIVMDSGVRVSDNARVIGAIRRQTQADVLVMTTQGVDRDVLRALSAGAVGYLLSESSATELVNAVRLIAQGQGFIDPAAVRRLAGAVADRTELLPAEVDEEQIRSRLTSREIEVLGYVRSGLSNLQIANRLDVSENTIKTHVSRTLTKLGLRSRVEAALAVRDVQLRAAS